MLKYWIGEIVMQEKKCNFDKIDIVYLPGISSQIFKFGIGLIFIQFLCIPVFAQSVEYYEGYNVISYDDGSKDITHGDFNFLRWDNVWRPNDELNISNGSWPYLYSGNATTANFKVDDTTLSIPTANTIFKKKQNSISQVLTFSKSELQGKETSINLTSAFIGIPYNLKSKKSKNKYEDKYNINYGRFNFKAGKDHITIHDDTLRDYIEDGEVFQDVTYLFEDDYDFIIENGEIRLKFKKKALEKLAGNVIIEINTWYVNGPNNWGGNDIAFSQTTDVKATGNVELRQKVDDYKLYTRFDEGSGRTIHNENTGNVLTGNLEGSLTSNTWVTNGKYGKAIYFNGIDTVNGNRVLFNNHPDIRLPGNFVISLFLYHTGYDNPDTDIIRKGSTSTASAWNKIEVGAALIPNTIYAFIEDPSSKVELKDTTPDRRDGKWHFIALTREGTTCKLMVDGVTVTTKTCSSNTANTAKLSIGAKDSAFPDDYIEGLIDEVRIYDRILTPTELTFIKNNEHFTAGTVTRNLSSIIRAGEELKDLGCNGTWDRSITTVDILASANNINWDMIQSNAYPNVNYTVDTGNNYKYIRYSLITTNASRTPIIESIRARISSSITPPQSTIPPQPWNLQYSLGNYWVNHTWQAGTGVVTDDYNISINGLWHNGTNSYYNDSAGASNWSDITVWAWNKSGSGNMSAFSVSQNIQVPLFLSFINGTIIGSENKSGLAGVKVFTNTSLSTVTNATGFYSFEVTSGDYNITATLEPIYYPNSTNISLLSAVVVQDIELLKKPTGNITGSVNA